MASSSSSSSAPTNPFSGGRFLLLPSIAYRLSKIDTSHLRLPNYTKATFSYLLNELTNKGFRNQVVAKNPNVPISRVEMDALWVKLLLEYFRTWELTQQEATRAEKKAHHASWMRSQLSIALNQRMGRMGLNKKGKVFDDADAWWADFALVHPGLDITANPELEDETDENEDETDENEDETDENEDENDSEGEDEDDGGDGEMEENGDVDMDMDMEGEGEEDRMDAEVFTLAYRPRHQDDGMGDDMEE